MTINLDEIPGEGLAKFDHLTLANIRDHALSVPSADVEEFHQRMRTELERARDAHDLYARIVRIIGDIPEIAKNLAPLLVAL